ncbi:putative structural protein [Myzus persicae nicotianae densovirus]|uniref:Putative structural protein n=1 Tax=Myzus persicae nicotianae densovirus TaxID=1742422 RepID=A0A0P0RT44_9VIRU|nr:putative structural protein [Myzus persicae nicotianae densovirus]
MREFRYLGPPPPERPNWQNLNSSQQRYSLEQYNKALARRSLPPYVLGGVEEDPDLDWDYDGNGNPNSGEASGDHVANTSAPDNSTSNGNGGSSSGSMASSSGSGSKRPADSSGSEPAPKRAGGTSLPGTAAANDGDPDTGNPSSENAVIPRPIGHTGGYTMVYRKVHTFISYGCGWKVLRYLNTDNAYLGTTSLMSVPVDQPWFYMSPSEFKFLPRGAICTEVKCKGVMRNPRTAFETNSSTSSLATLNQNKFMVKADALNLKTRGFNRKLTFGNSSEPMDPTNTENDQSSMKEFVRKLYGQDLDGSFSAKEGYELPASYMNLPLMYNSYFCNFVNRNHNSGKLGWERFNEHITKVDASFTVGTTVLNYSYKPHVGILTLPHDPIFDACVSVQEPNSSKFAMLRNAGNEPECQDFINAASGLFERRSDQKLTYVAENGWKRIFGNDRYCTNIDVGQYFRMFDKHEYSNKVQPSVHVGIYPVHKLTTATNSIVPVNFTDVECTWDFETEMTVSFGCPQSRTAFDRLHVEYEKTWLLADDNYNQNLYNRADLSIVHGLYVAPEKVADNQNAAAHSSGLTKEMGKASTTKNIDSFTTPADATVTTPVPASVRVNMDDDPMEVEASNIHEVRVKAPIKIPNYVYRESDRASKETLINLHKYTTTPPTTEEIMNTSWGDYNNPNWWPEERLFKSYSTYLAFCRDLTLWRRSMNIPIVNEPVDFLRK